MMLPDEESLPAGVENILSDSFKQRSGANEIESRLQQRQQPGEKRLAIGKAIQAAIDA
jgi:hypothetical protein